jgi:hypothetical protein
MAEIVAAKKKYFNEINEYATPSSRIIRKLQLKMLANINRYIQENSTMECYCIHVTVLTGIAHTYTAKVYLNESDANKHVGVHASTNEMYSVVKSTLGNLPIHERLLITDESESRHVDDIPLTRTVLDEKISDLPGCIVAKASEIPNGTLVNRFSCRSYCTDQSGVTDDLDCPWCCQTLKISEGQYYLVYSDKNGNGIDNIQADRILHYRCPVVPPTCTSDL